MSATQVRGSAFQLRGELRARARALEGLCGSLAEAELPEYRRHRRAWIAGTLREIEESLSELRPQRRTLAVRRRRALADDPEGMRTLAAKRDEEDRQPIPTAQYSAAILAMAERLEEEHARELRRSRRLRRKLWHRWDGREVLQWAAQFEVACGRSPRKRDLTGGPSYGTIRRLYGGMAGFRLAHESTQARAAGDTAEAARLGGLLVDLRSPPKRGLPPVTSSEALRHANAAEASRRGEHERARRLGASAEGAARERMRREHERAARAGEEEREGQRRRHEAWKASEAGQGWAAMRAAERERLERKRKRDRLRRSLREYAEAFDTEEQFAAAAAASVAGCQRGSPGAMVTAQDTGAAWADRQVQLDAEEEKRRGDDAYRAALAAAGGRVSVSGMFDYA